MAEFSHIPTVEIGGKRSGKTLLVTAGMDGDEYAGIEAAKRLITRLSDEDISGRLIIIPTVNLDGFRSQTSENPSDGKLPKNIFPGRASGSSSERLINWLMGEHVSRADAWIDLHGGASDEFLNPFLLLYKTGVREFDMLAERFISHLSAEIVLMQRAGLFSKPRSLARAGKFFLIAESGQRGRLDEQDIERHARWVAEIMVVLGMLETTSSLLSNYSCPGLENRHSPVVFKKLLRRYKLKTGDTLLWWKDGGPYFVGR